MKQKTSITLSRETMRALDQFGARNRSRIIEQAVIEFLERQRREQRENRDRAILDQSFEAMNQEMADVLDYQGEV